MPLYEYRCGNDHINELLMPMSRREDTVVCPDCGEDAEVIWSPVHHMFTGFLRDDFWDDWEKNTPGDYQELRGEKKTLGIGI